MLDDRLIEVLKRSIASRKEIHSFLRKIKKSKQLDLMFHEAHSLVFSKTDCLNCANCCKTTSPIFRDADIRRIAKHLKTKESILVSEYLKLDEDNDYVLKTSPCTFLGHDNKCSIYEHRPLACREYPHTNRKHMHQILNLTEKNTQICPAVAQIVFQLMG